jgi:hypothetical protein
MPRSGGRISHRLELTYTAAHCSRPELVCWEREELDRDAINTFRGMHFCRLDLTYGWKSRSLLGAGVWALGKGAGAKSGMQLTCSGDGFR